VKRSRKTVILSAIILLSIVLIGYRNSGDNGGGNGTTPYPAALSVSSLSISPTEINPNDIVRIEATIRNTGGSHGVYEATLNIDGIPVTTESVTLSAGASQNTAFDFSTDKIGTHSVAICSQSGEFTVVRRIIFASNRDGDYEIYAMNTNSSNVMKLTDNPAFDFLPSWSPDGKMIVFSSDRDGNEEIYVMNTDGSNVVQLTDNPAHDSVPQW
jgi:regulatory protein YycH of two-component signal transduction system YycFG